MQLAPPFPFGGSANRKRLLLPFILQGSFCGEVIQLKDFSSSFVKGQKTISRRIFLHVSTKKIESAYK